MKTYLILSLLALSTAAVAQESDWDYGRNQIMEESILEIREYPQFKYLPSSHVRLFASCIAEKRIQMGKKLGCKWQMKPGITAQEHLAEQYQCFEEGGYGKAQRTEHGEFCGILIREYFRALESNNSANK